MRSAKSAVERMPRWESVTLCLVLLAGVGVADRYITVERFMALLYLFPVALGAWLVGRFFGLSLALVVAVSSYAADSPAVHLANSFGTLGIFAAVALLVSSARNWMAAEHAARRVLEGIVDAIPMRVFWKDKNLVFLGCNATFARDAGLVDPKDIIGKNDHQLAWRDQAESYRADDRQVIESGRARLLIEEQQTTPEGTTITLLTSKVPLRGLEGEVGGVLGAYMDISDRKRNEAALLAAQVAYRRLFETAKDGILILNAETGIVVDANPFLAELLGVSRESILGRTIWELGCLKDILATREQFAEWQRQGDVRYEDTVLYASPGRRIDVEFVSNVYEVTHDRVIQCNIRDITERKRADESSRRLATAVEQAAESIVITDASGTIVYTNPAFEKNTGYTSAEALGQNPRMLKSGKQAEGFYRQMWATLRQGSVWSGRFVNKRRDGTLFEEEATISPIRDAKGTIVNYVAVKRDVSKETRLEQQLFQARKLEAIGSLAGGVAHDFNNLLGVIKGYGEIVHRQLADADPSKGKVDQILRAAERAAGLTRQLLAFGRKQVLQPRVLDLNAVVSDMDKMLRRLIGENIDFKTLREPQLARVKADPGQIEQVIVNLAVNARDAMADGGRLIIETHNANLDQEFAVAHPPVRPGRYVALVITDSGSGMDSATQARIFEPFFSTKGVGHGTGLGLATVYGIVKQSGGYIWVYSEVGVGTTFKIYLPRIDDEAAVERRQDAGPLLRGTETVLLVEDEASLREMLCEILGDSGYSVLAARDGAEALQIAEAHGAPIQLMVTDVIMPGMTGPRLVDLLAPTRPEMKVLFVSGYSDESVTQQGLIGPGRAFLSKPFGSDALLRKVRESLDAA